MGQVIAMRAVPGAGKSTFAKRLIAEAQAEGKSTLLCSADDYFYQLGGGKYQFDPSKISDAHKACFKKFVDAINRKIDVIIVDNTNISAWELSPYKSYAEINDYDFSIAQVLADPKKALQRQQHNVPEQAHETMRKRFQSEFIPPWWQSKTYLSDTSEKGEPEFKELPAGESRAGLIGRLVKLAENFALRYRF